MEELNVAQVLEELLHDETLDADPVNREIIIGTVTGMFSTY